MRIKALALAVLFAVTAEVAATAAQGQPGTTITGVAVDATGAVLPNAQVQLKSAGGTTEQSTSTDNTGAFHFDHVAPGRHDLLVTFEGFQPTTVRVTVGNRAPAPFRVTLPLAGITQEVTVGSAAAEVKTDTASNLDVSGVDATSIENLPVFNQDILATMSRFLDASAIGTN